MVTIHRDLLVETVNYVWQENACDFWLCTCEKNVKDFASRDKRHATDNDGTEIVIVIIIISMHSFHTHLK